MFSLCRAATLLTVLAGTIAPSFQMDDYSMDAKMYWEANPEVEAVMLVAPDDPDDTGVDRRMQELIANEHFVESGDVTSAVGRLRFLNPEGKGYLCSATVVRDSVPGRTLILTAAHCVSNEYSGVMHTKFMFIPGQDDGGTDKSNLNCGDDRYGCWFPNAGYVDTEWVTREWFGNMPWDYAVLVVADYGRHAAGYANENPNLGEVVTPMQIDFVNALGLPGDGGRTAQWFGYDARFDPKLRYCQDEPLLVKRVWLDGPEWRFENCGLHGGASGGPAVNNPSGMIFSVLSYADDVPPGKRGGPVLYDNSFSCLFLAAQTGDLPSGSVRDGFRGMDIPYDGTPCVKMLGGAAFGDPHFLTWGGHYFDYHGACDLVLAESKGFMDGLGFAAHVRSKNRYQYSYIESAAIQIGDDIIEVGEYGWYMVNGVSVQEGEELPLMGGKFQITRSIPSEHDVQFDIELSYQEVITIKVHKDLVNVHFSGVHKEHFQDVVGIMGDFADGTHYSRNGEVMTDDDAFGQEWQVHPGIDPELFLSKSKIEWPAHQCVLPSATSASRRLSASSVSLEEATTACDQFSNKEARDACIYDVIATGDLETANVGAF